MKNTIFTLLISSLLTSSALATITAIQVAWDYDTIATANVASYVLKQAKNTEMTEAVIIPCSDYQVIGTIDGRTDMTMECPAVDVSKENVYYTLTAVDNDGTSRTSEVYILDIGPNNVQNFRLL